MTDQTVPRFPRFPDNAELCIDTASGAEMWSGRRWNDFVSVAERNQSQVTVRLISIEEPGEPQSEHVSTPRRVPTMAERVGCGHTPEQHRHLDGQDAADRSKDRAIAELTIQRDNARSVYRDAAAERDELQSELTDAWAAITTANRPGPHSIAEHITRLAAELTSTQQVATWREGRIYDLSAKLGAAEKLIAVYDDVTEQLDRARARYATRPEVTREPEDAPDTEAEAPLGSPDPRAQDDRNALVYNAVSRALLDCDPWAPLATLRERCTAAVLAALDEREARP
ncbi:hypothetical protein ABZ749_01115 [Micromonospora sp. NPDC047753]|uniref:hypothetical protein n=1 Tax=Micromonospora sp. NPDC047753 TaxID=3154817 RepID=UPI0033D8BD34